jgi:hypothetical protein
MKFSDAGKFLYAALKIMVPKVAEVEQDIKLAKSGPHKRAAVVSAVLDGLSVAHDLSGKDLLGHPKAIAVIQRVNDEVVKAQNDLVAIAAEAAAEHAAKAPAGSSGD